MEESLTRDISKIFNSCCSRRRIYKKSRIWLMEETVEKRKIVKKKIREHIRLGRDSIRKSLKKTIFELRKQIRIGRKECWNRFLEKTIEKKIWRATTYIGIVRDICPR
jgi:hypothetical protein